MTGPVRKMIGQGEFSHPKIPILLCLHSCCITSSSPLEKEHQNKDLVFIDSQRDASWVTLTFQSDCSRAITLPFLSYGKGRSAVLKFCDCFYPSGLLQEHLELLLWDCQRNLDFKCTCSWEGTTGRWEDMILTSVPIHMDFVSCAVWTDSFQPRGPRMP